MGLEEADVAEQHVVYHQPGKEALAEQSDGRAMAVSLYCFPLVPQGAATHPY